MASIEQTGNDQSRQSISTTFHHDTDTKIGIDDSLPPSVTHSRIPSVEAVHPPPPANAQGKPPIILTPLSTPAIHAQEKQKIQSRHEKKNCAYFWYRYINPWIRLILFILILYFYLVMSAFTTLRENQFHTHLPHGYYGDPKTEYEGVSNPPIPFALKDTIHENLYAPSGSTYDKWKAWADFTVAFFQLVLILWLIIARDIIRITEYIACQMVLFFWNAIAHVVTTYPDPAYYQYELCTDPKYNSEGRWLAWTATLSYCGDHMWSGHTANTLIAIIFLRRLIWDTIGWNFHYLYPGEFFPSVARQPYTLIDATGHHQWNWGYTGQDIHMESTRTITTQHDIHSAHPQVAWNPDAPSHSIGTSDIEMGNADINKKMEYDGNEDTFLRIRRSQYTSPEWVIHHRTLVWLLWTTFRLLLLPWHASQCVAVLVLRFHYTADVVIANLMVVFLVCNPYFVQILVRWLYRPNYWNYQWKHWWAPIYIDNPTNREQCNYEERVRRCGVGGLF